MVVVYLYLFVSCLQSFLHVVSQVSENNQLLPWDEAESELDRLTLRFSQLYYENLLSVSVQFSIFYVISSMQHLI